MLSESRQASVPNSVNKDMFIRLLWCHRSPRTQEIGAAPKMQELYWPQHSWQCACSLHSQLTEENVWLHFHISMNVVKLNSRALGSALDWIRNSRLKCFNSLCSSDFIEMLQWHFFFLLFSLTYKNFILAMIHKVIQLWPEYSIRNSFLLITHRFCKLYKIELFLE